MTFTQKAVEAAANEIRKVRLLLVNGSGAPIPSDHLYAEAALTAALAVDGLCLVDAVHDVWAIECGGAFMSLWLSEEHANKILSSYQRSKPSGSWNVVRLVATRTASTGDTPREDNKK